jgi:protein arginine kinase activator
VPIHNNRLPLRRKDSSIRRLTAPLSPLELIALDPPFRSVCRPHDVVLFLMTKCKRCSKPATLHITEIRSGAVQELHLCESCAQQYLNQEQDDSGESAEPSSQKEGESANEEYDHLICPNCGITFREFRSQGRLGCPHDYIAFAKELKPLLENIHNETQHTGKFPKRAPHASQLQYRLIKLRSELRAAIDEEEYETAARIRDEIQSLEKEFESKSRS